MYKNIFSRPKSIVFTLHMRARSSISVIRYIKTDIYVLRLLAVEQYYVILSFSEKFQRISARQIEFAAVCFLLEFAFSPSRKIIYFLGYRNVLYIEIL